MVRNFSMFLFVGGLSTGVQYLVLVLLVHYIAANPTLSSSLGYIFGGVVNYLLNRRLTFKSDSPHRRAAPRFIIVAITGLILNGTIMWFGTVVADKNYLFVQIIATAIVLLFNYTAHRTWSFSEDGVS